MYQVLFSEVTWCLWAWVRRLPWSSTCRLPWGCSFPLFLLLAIFRWRWLWALLRSRVWGILVVWHRRYWSARWAVHCIQRWSCPSCSWNLSEWPSPCNPAFIRTFDPQFPWPISLHWPCHLYRHFLLRFVLHLLPNFFLSSSRPACTANFSRDWQELFLWAMLLCWRRGVRYYWDLLIAFCGEPPCPEALIYWPWTSASASLCSLSPELPAPRPRGTPTNWNCLWGWVYHRRYWLRYCHPLEFRRGVDHSSQKHLLSTWTFAYIL